MSMVILAWHRLTRQLDAEGIKKQVIVTDEPELIHLEEGIAAYVRNLPQK